MADYGSKIDGEGRRKVLDSPEGSNADRVMAVLTSDPNPTSNCAAPQVPQRNVYCYLESASKSTLPWCVISTFSLNAPVLVFVILDFLL